MTGWTAALAIAASVTFLARLLPQPLRTFRTGQVAGVSAVAAINAFIADAAWLAYGLSARVVAVWLVSIPALLASGWTAALLRKAVRRRDVAVSSGWLLVVVASAGVGQLVLALSLTVLVCCGPALWSAYTSSEPAGLTRWTWWLALADATLWGGYGLLIADRALQLYGGVMLATAVAVLLRLRPLGARVRMAG